MPNNSTLIFCTCPDKDTAESIARKLVESRLAACVNILPGLTSIYVWQDRISSAEEHLLLIKSTDERYAGVEQTILSLHPYELPEIVALPISRGLPAYLNWIDSCVSAD